MASAGRPYSRPKVDVEATITDRPALPATSSGIPLPFQVDRIVPREQCGQTYFRPLEYLSLKFDLPAPTDGAAHLMLLRVFYVLGLWDSCKMQRLKP